MAAGPPARPSSIGRIRPSIAGHKSRLVIARIAEGNTALAEALAEQLGITTIDNQDPGGLLGGIGSIGEDPDNPGNPPAYFAQSFVSPGGTATQLTFELTRGNGPTIPGAVHFENAGYASG